MLRRDTMDDDYIKELNSEEKLAFLKIFCKMIKSDGSIDSEEVAFLKMIASRYGVDNASIVEIVKSTNLIDLSAEAHKITKRSHALELIKELCVLANVDNDLDDSELDIIIDLAREMNIEDEKVVLINRWVLD